MDRPEVAPLPVPGEWIDVFELEQAIGAGGMGAVFRAVDTRLDRLVALKILPPDQAVDPEVVRRYQQEGRAAARLDHENIARVYTIGDSGGYHYIAFEYIEGTTVRQRVEQDGPMAVGVAVDLTLQIANALVHAAGRGVVHRDIKPSNIIVTPGGRAKLVDMGLARRFERGDDTGLTQSGTTLGTFDYISPEQARDPRDVDVRGDLYSLGCTLFHMLSGRPPFPDGTVLQKLLQHQEEPPPDIRKLNPAVPEDLAAVLVKLMAKDRDRRYQAPEQLVRDLLAVAGSLGLRPPRPGGAARKVPSPARGWARRLAWAVPGMLVVVALAVQLHLLDGPDRPPTRALIKLVPPKAPPRPGLEIAAIPAPVPVASPADPTPAPSAAEIAVGDGEDLLRALAEAPPRSTIVLTEAGPYEIRGGRGRPLLGLDLTIRAGVGVRPVIRFPADPGLDAATPSALLDLRGGHVAVEGVEFVVDHWTAAGRGRGGGRAEAPAAIRIEDAEVSLRRCSFRRPGGASLRLRPAALVARSRARAGGGGVAGERSASLWIDACDFEGGQAGVIATGPVAVSVRDCAFGPAPTDLATFWSDNPEASAVLATFRLDHASVLVGPGPVFRFGGTAPRVRVAASAFAPPSAAAAQTPATLVAIDSPDRLDWRGVDNLYAQIAVYLRSGGTRAPIRSFEGWADDSSFRESGSAPFDGHPWAERDPLAAIAQVGPESGRPFRLALPRPASVAAHLGAREGPLGPIPAPTMLVAAPPPGPNPTVAALDPAGRPPRAEGPPAKGAPGGGSPPTRPDPARPPDVADDEMKEMPLTLPPARPGDLRGDEPGAPPPVAEVPPPVDAGRPRPTPAPPAEVPGRPADPSSAPIPAEPALIRAPGPLLEAIDRAGSGPKPLTLAADAELDLPAARFPGPSTCVIKAEKGATRPRLRFQPAPAAAPAPGDWAAWLTLSGGGLRVEGVDLVLVVPRLDAAQAPPKSWAAFAVASGTSLTLLDCTVTIEGADARSAVVAALAPAADADAARVRIKNCLFRVGDDLVDVAAGRAVDLEIENSAIATGGTLVHGHGLPRGMAAGPIKVVLRQVAARLADGLARLESAPGRPELPVADVSAHDTILATADPDTPLFQVDGQGDPKLLEDRVRWEGHAVAYHRIDTYRRDQTAQPNARPNLSRRDSWDVAPREDGPIHGDNLFLDDWAPGRAAWTLRPEDLRLRPDSPAGAAPSVVGPDLKQIPRPPSTKN